MCCGNNLPFWCEFSEDWSCQGTLNGPAETTNSTRDNGKGKSCFLCPCRNALSFTLKGKQMIRPAISLLFASCRPATVAGFVVALVVFAFDGIAISRWFAHVFQERFKRIVPSLAYLNAATAVAGIFGVFLVIAALNHLYPDPVERRASLSVFGHLCSEFGGLPLFAENASARSSEAVFQASAPNLSCVSAVTAANPQTVLFLVLAAHVENDKTTEALPGNVRCFHDVIIANKPIVWE